MSPVGPGMFLLFLGFPMLSGMPPSAVISMMCLFMMVGFIAYTTTIQL